MGRPRSGELCCVTLAHAGKKLSGKKNKEKGTWAGPFRSDTYGVRASCIFRLAKANSYLPPLAANFSLVAHPGSQYGPAWLAQLVFFSLFPFLFSFSFLFSFIFFPFSFSFSFSVSFIFLFCFFFHFNFSFLFPRIILFSFFISFHYHFFYFYFSF